MNLEEIINWATQKHEHLDLSPCDAECDRATLARQYLILHDIAYGAAAPERDAASSIDDPAEGRLTTPARPAPSEYCYGCKDLLMKLKVLGATVLSDGTLSIDMKKYNAIHREKIAAVIQAIEELRKDVYGS